MTDTWSIEYGGDAFERFLLSLPPYEQAVLIAAIAHVLQRLGIDICSGEWGKPLAKGFTSSGCASRSVPSWGAPASGRKIRQVMIGRSSCASSAPSEKAVRTADALDDLLAHGQHAVTLGEASEILGVSPGAGLISGPGQQFIDAMMSHLGRVYYVGWLSAAEVHGSAHKRPQVLQVAVDAHVAHRDIGRGRLRFAEGRRVGAVPRIQHAVPTGRVWVSGVEVTMLDLADDMARGGGVNNVSTVLAELVVEAHVDPGVLAETATFFPL